jgi:hypothetical protein
VTKASKRELFAFIANFALSFRACSLDLFRREIEPMARRLIQLCEPDWFSNLL